MKQVRLVPAATAFGSIVLTAAIAFACSDRPKTTTASARSTAVVASSSAACRAAHMAAGAKCAKGAQATVAQAADLDADDCCAAKAKTSSGTTATVAPVGKVNAMAVGTGDGHSCDAAKGAAFSAGTAVAAGNGSSCGSAKSTAVAVGSGPSCSAHGLNSTAKATGHNCEACADFAMCEEEVRMNGATVQIVPLKNGVMYVYTATGAARVSAVQSAMARRSQHASAILAAGEETKLCSECKAMRGAIASGKLSRETVNIEGGCMTLVTSSDPSMVSRIYTHAGLKANGRTKS